MASNRRLALVTPWYGRDQLGGAERLAWDLAHALVRAGAQVEVLTTCCRSFHDDWAANYFRPGVTLEAGVTVRRFKVDSRDRTAFARANARLLALPREVLKPDGEPLDERAWRAFFTENITSRALVSHLRDRGASYDAVLFVPYLYGTTIAGIEHVADRAFVIPCLHDEAYAYLGPVRDLFERARGVLFNSDGEAEMAAALYGPALLAKSSTIGHAIDAIPSARAGVAIGGFVPQRARYLLALGRQDRTKNTDFLLDAYAKFREQHHSSSLQLVLAGPRPASLRVGPGVLALGVVPEEAKSALLHAARALVQPSTNESFSRAIYEAWSVGRPVVVHTACRATARAVEDAGGGWTGATLDAWVRIFAEIDSSASNAIDAIGARGRAAARENGTWDDVAARTLAAIDLHSGAALAGWRIDQLVPLGEREAAQRAAAIDTVLRANGADASIAIAESAVIRPGAVVISHTSSGAIADEGAAVLSEPVDPGVWAGIRLDGNPYADERLTLVSVSPLASTDAHVLTEIVLALLAIAPTRFIIHRDMCSREALAVLERDRRDLDLADALVLTDGSPRERFTAFRAASLACVFGQPGTTRALIEPLWFDVPLVGFAQSDTDEIMARTGVMFETRDARAVAAALRVICGDNALRMAMCAESRRIRAHASPVGLVRTLIDRVVRVRVSAQQSALPQTT